jgi:hypothetical protein
MDARVAPSLIPQGMGLATRTIYPRGVALSTWIKAGPRLQAIRYLVVLVGGIVAGGRVVEAIAAWREWRRWMTSDPSGADAYRTFLVVNVAAAILAVCLAALVWHLLRPKDGSGGS